MKKLTLITAIILIANLLFAQYNKIDTSFYSEALQETKMVDVYFPPGYDENPDNYYPVIYYLHAWFGNQNTMGSEMIAITQSMINDGIIDPVILVGADNSPEPFDGSMYANSLLWGNYEEYMVDDLVNWVESSFRAIPEKDYRALLGHSMGGYGAFRYGILHKDKFRVLAATSSAIINLTDDYLEYSRQKIMQQNLPGPPFYYDYNNTGGSTMGIFLFCGAFAPNYNTSQTYINPQIVEFVMDDNGDYIDTIVDKIRNNSIDHLIHQLSPVDSVGILFGCGSADVSIYPSHLAFMDTLDLLGLPYEFYDHTGGHIMPYSFKERALIFMDSLMMPPVLQTSCLPEGIYFTTQEEIDSFQVDYPGCTEIVGGVEISGSDITSLYGLNILNSIGGDFFIGNQYNLINLSGLESLHSIGGSLFFYRNEDLVTSEGLNALETIGGSLHIGCGDFWMPGGTSLQSLAGFENLHTVDGKIEIFRSGLTNLQGLESLTSIAGDLDIISNDLLTSLDGIQNIDTSSIENIFIGVNSNLSECNVLSICNYLISPTGIISINNNAPGCNSEEEVIDACFNSVNKTPCLRSLSISPNPVKYDVILSLNLLSPRSIEVCMYNAIGICLKKWKFPNEHPGQRKFELDLNDFSPGIYFCKIMVGDEIVTTKIIKQ